jgi:two-component system cell cycle sensor histidine kinase/response regulator CckA
VQPLPSTAGRGETILVVDDEPHQRDIATEILSELGYRVRAVSSGAAAIAYVKEQPVDLLLLDMSMEPGLDGCETYVQICALYPGQKAVIVSGYAESQQVEKALDLGAGSFLKKPYTLEQLGAAIGAALQRD